ncbi:MAG: SMP-30/gluconolactonase/LRE family protein [Chloroflexi bacterium]|nr:SMP-30/gluconolactonase/LRE family protein [Chloroflexota bacterium]
MTVIERADAALDHIAGPDLKYEKLADGFMFTEGPVWVRQGGYLLFSDIPAGRIHKWSPKEGASVYREPSFKSNGLTLDRQGRLIACEHVGRRVSRTEADGKVVAIARGIDGNRLNSPNDVVSKSDGATYFSDPDFGLRNDRIGAQAPKEFDFNGVWRAGTDGQLTPVAKDFSGPNGLAFSPDESVLYVDDTMKGHIRAFDVKKDGMLENGRVFAQLTGDGPGAPDGMKIDVEGNVYCTGPGCIHIYTSKGKFLGRLKLGHIANIGWGDDDWRTLYLASLTAICRIRLKIPGIPVGAK